MIHGVSGEEPPFDTEGGAVGSTGRRTVTPRFLQGGLN